MENTSMSSVRTQKVQIKKYNSYKFGENPTEASPKKNNFRWIMAGAAVVVLIACIVGGYFLVNSVGVAATVNGEQIKEQDVTDYIQNYREQSGMSDEDTWGQFLAANSMTPETFRKEQILEGYMVQNLLLKQGIREYGVTVSSSEVDERIEQIKSSYDDEDAFNEALEQYGYTMDKLREEQEFYLQQQKLAEKLMENNGDDTSEDELSYAEQCAEYYNGSKKASYISFPNSMRDKAQECLDKINSGTDFATAQEEYKQDSDTDSSQNILATSDVWSADTTIGDEYTNALSALAVDQVSGLVDVEERIYIIKCTDEFTAPEEITSLDQLKDDWAEQIRDTVKQSHMQSALSEWYEEKENNSTIVINDMPKDVPYAIADMSKYETSSSSSSDSDTSSSDSSSSTESTESTSADTSSTSE